MTLGTVTESFPYITSLSCSTPKVSLSLYSFTGPETILTLRPSSPFLLQTAEGRTVSLGTSRRDPLRTLRPFRGSSATKSAIETLEGS